MKAKIVMSALRSIWIPDRARNTYLRGLIDA